ncbi:putative alcohol O-acetyltransferase [Lupinus albus]|uniref:Putative alcohol O-acetyltransferase n=1 Tax=Lupinus albus TaxID=3870 RepID=A0A6A4QVJ1_LUPAL|nr:putative alcohol O-acetyltransferase [Lupinus albus]
MEINITSRETIKPLLPTPNENKTHKLCLFDVFQQNFYFPIILFYHKTKDMQGFSQVSTQLKKSLSEALSIFYPLAGRRSDFFNINCNDEGAFYIEASLNFTIEEFINPPKLEFLNKLLPCEPNKTQPFQQVLPQLLIQVNIFKCGGIAICLCNLHTMLDACSCCAFLKTWSSLCKGLPKEEISQPDFSSASSFFPPRNIFGVRDGVLNIKPGLNKEKNCTTTRFLFNTNAINELMPMSENDETSSKTTCYQALSTFICKHMAMACMEEYSSCDCTRPVVVVHVVDIRRRMGEPFSQDSIGNLLWPIVLNYDKINMNTDVKDLVRIMREGIGKFTKELFLRMQSDAGFLWSDECGELMHEGLVEKNPIVLVFTSWVNIGFNELDFGWGKPLWLALRGGNQETMPNATVFMETKEGIEAWVTMEQKNMAILENNVDFSRFALLNPSALNIKFI